VEKFCDFADFLLNKIRENNDTTFQVHEIEDFLNSIYQNKLKAPSADKKDIVITVEDTI